MRIKTRKRALTLMLATAFLFIIFSILHPFLHDHAHDGEFHSNCSGCHFALTVSSLLVFILVFVVILTLIGYFERNILSNLINKFLPLTKGRAPPANMILLS